MTTSIIIPSLGRTWQLARLFQNIFDTTPGGDVETVVISEDPDTIHMIHAEYGALVELIEQDGTPVRKWNIGAAHASGDWLVLLGDDCLLLPGWFDTLQATPNHGFVGLYEGVDWVEAVGHFAISRALACDLFGGVLALPPYQAGYFDQEMCIRLHDAGCYTRTPHVVLQHNHPSLSRMPEDDTYRRGQAMQQKDAHVFYQRQARGWPNDWQPILRRDNEST